MRRTAVTATVFAFATMVLACGGAFTDDNCASSFCGCWQDVTLQYRAKVAEADGSAVVGATVQCSGGTPATPPPVATTDADGFATFTYETQESGGCGYNGCNFVRAVRPDGGSESFWTERTNGRDIVLGVDAGDR